MPKIYPIFFKQNVIDFVIKDKNTQIKAVHTFHVAERTVQNWIKEYKKNNNQISPRKIYQRKYLKINPQELEKYATEHHNDTTADMAKIFKCSPSGILRALKKLGFCYKKKHFYLKKQMKKKEKFF